MPSYGTLRADCLAALELNMVRKGGYHEANGKQYGFGLAEHIKRFAKLAWPDFKWDHRERKQRWAHMICDEICEGGTVACYGPASSGKTATAAVTMLVMYWAHPECFTGLCSTTTLEKLDVRIWGEIQMRFKQAREKYPWLSGHIVSSKRRICTDAKDETDGRDFRNGILGVACQRSSGEWQGLGDYCFPSGELVDTPAGARNIASVRKGDLVMSAIGTRKVKHAGSRIAPALIRIQLKDGRHIDCTPEHPVLTQMGWKNAVDLNSHHRLISSHEAVQAVRNGVEWEAARKREILQQHLSYGGSPACMRHLPGTLHTEGQAEHFLWQILRDEMEDVAALVCKEDSRQNQRDGQREENQRVDYAKPAGSHTQITTAQGIDQGTACRSPEERLEEIEVVGRKSIQDLQARNSNTRRESNAGYVSRSSLRASNSIKTSRRRFSTLLSAGFRMAGIETGGGDRRRDPHTTSSNSPRQTQGAGLEGAWVDFVEVLERRSDERYNASEGGYRVYNLQVEGHPSFSVNGIVVHNSGIKNTHVMLAADECHVMQSGFLQGVSNLKSNRNFTGAFLGNLVDLETPLGEAAEPDCGWDALPDSSVSRVYKTKFFNGRAIQLIGKDSPNFDYPEGQEPYDMLIGRRFIAELKHDCGEGSPMYIAQAGGGIPRSSLANRVITKQVCHQFSAFEPVVWGSGKLTKLYCMDVSYTVSHGDRTCGAPMQFGLDVDGKPKLAFMERPKIYAFTGLGGRTVEEAIASLVKKELDKWVIPYSSFFFDGTGRSSFTAAAMREMGTSIQPVEFGGKASERPNFMGRRFQEGPEKGELMPCFMVFGKFVSELWFATRYLIEADQQRDLPEDTARDGYMRLWTLGAGNKIDVESKVEMKTRVNRSPDLYDMYAVGVEGARRLGFTIGTALTGGRNARGNAWLKDLKTDLDKQMREQELTYA